MEDVDLYRQTDLAHALLNSLRMSGFRAELPTTTVSQLLTVACICSNFH
jgi:hypothetical protein